MHLFFLRREISSSNPILLGAFTVVCAQLELGYGIMASSVPCLKPFMSAYEGPRPLSHGGSGKRSNLSYELSSTRSATKRIPDQEVVTTAAMTTKPPPALWPDQNTYSATVSHRDQRRREGSIDSNDSRSMIIRKDMVIKKEVKWSVEHDVPESSSNVADGGTGSASGSATSQ